MYLYIVTLLIVMYMCYYWLHKTYNYWNDRGINGPKPLPIVGNYKTIMLGKEHIQDFIQRVYEDFPNDNYIGIYQFLTPALVIKDPEIIKQVLIKDFKKFHDREFKDVYPFNDNIVTAKGDRWKVLRSIFTSALTLSKIKNYMPALEECEANFLKYIHGMLESGSIHDIQDLFGLILFNAAGLSLFGIDFNVYSKEKKTLQDLIKGNESVISKILYYLNLAVPGVLTIANFLQIGKGTNETQSIFLALLNKVMQDRNTRKTPLVDLIIELKKTHFIEKQYDDKTIRIESTNNLILAQAMVMLVGHVHAPTRVTSMVMYELSLHQSVQDRLYGEINKHFRNNNNKITYESLNKMIYLDMVIKETFRKHFTTGCQRRAACDYEFPKIGLKIKKGTMVMIPAQGLHNDPKYFKDPDAFDPERFSAVNKRKIIDCTLIPFGLGPRNCPGALMTELLAKFCIASFLLKFKVDACDKTEKKLQYDPGFIKLKVTGGIWVKISQRSVLE